VITTLGTELWCFDSEWIPDVKAGRALYDLEPAEPLEEVEDVAGGRYVELPAGFFPAGKDYVGFTDYDVVQEMYRRHKDYDAETNPRPFLKPIMSEVVTIAFVRRTVSKLGPLGGVDLQLKVVPGDTEAELLFNFLNAASRKPILVGYNSKDADLPLILQRAMVHGISAPDFCKRPEKPWMPGDYWARETDYHIDLMYELAGMDRRSKPTLSEACVALGIDGPKTTKGGDVLDLVRNGRLAEARWYCASDAVRQFRILLRRALLAGLIGPRQEEEETGIILQQLHELLRSTSTT
jgi:predicted PolB exonuclease-like 3'-5' exonuclease